jgi:hypothetical protein
MHSMAGQISDLSKAPGTVWSLYLIPCVSFGQYLVELSL